MSLNPDFGKPKPKPVIDHTAIFCEECGEKVASNTAHCALCGAKVLRRGGLAPKEATPGLKAKATKKPDTQVTFDDGITPEWSKFINPKSQHNWILFDLKDACCTYRVAAKSGLTGLKNILKTKGMSGAMAVGMVRVYLVDKKVMGSRRDKLIYFFFIGSSVPPGQYNFLKTQCKAFFEVAHLKGKKGSNSIFHVSLDIKGQDMDIFTPRFLAEHLLNAGGAHKPTHYDFGGGDELELATVASHKDSDGEESDEDFD